MIPYYTETPEYASKSMSPNTNPYHMFTDISFIRRPVNEQIRRESNKSYHQPSSIFPLLLPSNSRFQLVYAFQLPVHLLVLFQE
jgi:hypothetical protein